jgi:methyl-accepting chemotaxis protein
MGAFMSVSVARKFTLASLVFVFALVFVTGGAWLVSEELGKIQDTGAGQVRMAMEVQSLSARGAAMYQVIADGEINHDLGVTRTDWQATKAQTDALFATVKAKLQSEAERKDVACP